ncbi:magnesium-transporting ATPase (P-type) [Methanolinea mesophila]|uniref:cation-translocating P-type ATPase n=1 Tax=Methanolinea mesophila TaxID=547055 RepID=UPI001AE5C035|nr:HAD-IC family P-type ATPase [Methanolinea mesophila]MBP1929096.1 magnesium-transporting ATPase (P-type) [Methanolinea mesophila]
MDEDLRGNERISWHSRPIEEVYERLCTGPSGLSEDEAEKRLEQYGPNVLPAKKPPGVLILFLRQFKSPLIYILLIAAVISYLLQDVKDAAFILLVVMLNAAIGLVQEWKAEQSAHKLEKLLHITAQVHRAGHDRRVDATLLVPGDLVSLESGDRVPADLRLTHSAHLSVDESILTGESITVEKSLPVLPGSTPLPQRSNMVFGGTTVTSGRGAGVVTATGMQSEVGAIAEAVATTEAAKPPLIARMERFSLRIGLLVVGASVLMAAISLSRGAPLAEVFFLAVALAVSAIPEGLPVAITVALSIGASRMAERNVIIRRLAAVESLGSCTMIATDKTGTLTVNQQTVTRIILPTGSEFSVTGTGYSGSGSILSPESAPPGEEDLERIKKMARAAAICNEGSLYSEGDRWISSGDAMDVALLAYGYKAGIEPDRVRGDLQILHEIPYEPERRYQAVYFREDGQVRIAVKGAVETLIPYCVSSGGKEWDAPRDTATVEVLHRSLTRQGFRVLAVAEGTLPELPPEPLELEVVRPPLTLLGLAGFIDPLRPDVPDAVKRCRNAGIEVAMITGDHPDTALAIAKKLEIADDEGRVVTGTDLDSLGSSDIPEFLRKVDEGRVFARVSPLQKLQIVNAMIRNGHFVAVTGDGVNDAPALRRANIGVAMGSGSDVAKDTSSMIVTDDDFSSIVSGIEEGRFAYDNIRKVTYLLISTGFAEIILFTLALLFGLPLPLFAVQLLWLNLVTNGIQDVALAFEKGEPETMSRPPRRPDEGVFNRLMVRQTVLSGMVIGIIAFSTWFWLLHEGWDEALARSMLVLLMVLLENFHALNCRSEYRSLFSIPLRNNYLLIGGIVMAQAVQIAAMNIPFMQEVLQIGPVSLADWAVFLTLASLVLVVMEIFKWNMRRQGHPGSGRQDGDRPSAPGI